MDVIDEMVRSMHTKAEATKSMYRQKGNRLHKTLGDVLITDIDDRRLDAYIARRRSSDREHGRAKDHTIQKELITVRRACKFALRRGYLKRMPMFPEFSPRYVPKTTWLTPEQFELVVAKFPPHRQLWLALAALGGMRSSEVERICGIHFDIGALMMNVPGEKTLESKRIVPIAPALMLRLVAVHGCSLPQGVLVQHWGNVRRDLHAACDAAGVPRVSPNDLRRTFASWLKQSGVDSAVIAGLLGHTSTRMVDRVYGKLSQEMLQSAIQKLPSGSGSVPTCVTTDVPELGTSEHQRHDLPDGDDE